MLIDEPVPAGATPAGTVVIVRDGVAGREPELLMLERAASLAFAPGALVFPGGRVDPRDRDMGGSPWDAARVAAIRETIEEAGLAVGLRPPTGQAVIAGLRGGLAGGADLDRLLDAAGLSVAADALMPLARWCPAADVPHRFDTRFFLCRLDGAREARADGGECVAAHWATPRQFLSDGRPLLFPTRMVLERLARLRSWPDMAADAVAHPPRLIVPWTEDRDDVPWRVIPEGLGYPVCATPIGGARGA